MLQATSRIQLSEGGKIGRMLTQLKPVRINVLAGLPRGPFAFAVGSTTLQPLIDLRLDAIERSRNVYGLNEEQFKKWKESMRASLQGFRSGAMVMGPSDTIFGNCVALLHVDDAAKYMADYEKRVEATKKMAARCEEAGPLQYRIGEDQG